jgi:hypothetical protein
LQSLVCLLFFYCSLLTAHRSLSFDHPIRPRQHVRRNGQADLLGSFEIDYQLELCRLFVSIPFFLDLVSEPQIA